MNHRSDRTPRFTRIATTLGLAGVAAIAVAARSQAAQQPPVATPTAQATTKAAPPAARVDSQPMPVMLGVDPMATMTARVALTPAPAVTRQPAPAPAWPVDAQGRTLVNGTPVVGKVFVMQKVDGLVKYDYEKVYDGEPIHPELPIVSARHQASPPGHARRMRGIMVEATLWSIDHKRSARELRTYRPVTPPTTAGQH